MPQHPDNELLVAENLTIPASEELTIPLHTEDVVVSRRKLERAVVRVATVTRNREQQVDEELIHERVEVEHVPIGLMIDAVPAVRVEGDVTIMPVVEEILVVEHRLILKEEVRIRRVRTTEHHLETITLREQEAIVTRIPAGAQNAGTPKLSSPEAIVTNKDQIK